MKRILIVGATSAIAEALARLFAARGDALALVARDAARLSRIAVDLRLRGAGAAHALVLDVNELDRHTAVLRQAADLLGDIDIALIAHGTLGNQAACEKDFALALRELNTNAISVMSLLTDLANRMEERGAGQLVVIGSVAGDRGRASNYVYGSAKAAVAAFCEGLRARLYHRGIGLLLVKPGFVDTPMTAAFRKGPLWSQPERVATLILRAIDRHRDVVYVPAFWALIMLVIRLLPRRIFLRLRF